MFVWDISSFLKIAFEEKKLVSYPYFLVSLVSVFHILVVRLVPELSNFTIS